LTRNDTGEEREMADLCVTTLLGIESMLAGATVDEFKRSLRGEVFGPGDAGYETARQACPAEHRAL
jgi:hypothetical protein